MKELDISKMTNEERELYKTYVEGLRDLKVKLIKEDIKELESRWDLYKEGAVSTVSRVYAMSCSIKRTLEELMEHDESLKEIDDCDREEAGEFIF